MLLEHNWKAEVYVVSQCLNFIRANLLSFLKTQDPSLAQCFSASWYLSCTKCVMDNTLMLINDYDIKVIYSLGLDL